MNPDFMARAIELSRHGMEAGAGGPFGAVIVRGQKIIAEAFNTVVATNDPSNHAELSAIRIASQQLNSFELSDCELYTNAEPCPMCFGAIYWARINKVYFANPSKEVARIGFDDSHIYRELTIPTNQRSIAFEHHSDEAAQAVFTEWTAKQDRVEY